MSKLTINLGYQTLYQLLAVCLPLITTPYISRVIGVEGLGIYSYTYSVVNYFTIFAMLGTLNYGCKIVATVKHSKRSLLRNFWEIYFLQLLASMIAMFCYIIVLFFVKNNNTIFAINIIWIVACAFDISWFFFGIEKFKTTVLRGTIIKFITLASIFIFIKSSEDLWKYVFIMAMGTLTSQLVLWPFLLREIGVYKPKLKDILRHLKPNLLLFVPLIAISVYHLMDKTMLGLFSTYEQSGIYYNADKIVNIPLSLITATGTVMLPRMTSLVAEGKKKDEIKLFDQSFVLIMFFTYALAFGIAAVANEFIPVFFGRGFDECIRLTYIFTIVMIVKSISNIIRNQYLIPNNKETVYTYSVVGGAMINLVCNIVFIAFLNMGAIGATLGTLIAEIVTCLFYIIFSQRNINILKPLVDSSIFIIPGLIMLCTVRFFARIDVTIVIKLIVEILVGAIIYLVCSFPILRFKNRIFILR